MQRGTVTVDNCPGFETLKENKIKKGRCDIAAKTCVHKSQREKKRRVPWERAKDSNASFQPLVRLTRSLIYIS